MVKTDIIQVQERRYPAVKKGKLFGYEFKWTEKRKDKAPKDWHGTYDNADES